MGRENVSLSKITPPLLSDVIPRKRPIIWICGPSGSGKTTLAASYLKNRKLPCLWYRMDEGDDDAGSFFYYLGLAAKKATPRSRRQLPLLSPENLLALPTFARRYFQNLYGRLKIPSVIVFDNYHDVPAGSLLHKVIHDGLAEVPSGINIIFTSRHDPPPSMADFRSKGMVETISWSALSLTITETEAIVKIHGKGLKFSEDAIDILHKRSGGWVAGLLLLLTEGQEKKPDHSSINIETPEVVFDYLAGEVFERIDDQTKTFLLKTAFLPGMTARMAEGLTGIPESGRILTYLYHNNLFIEKSPDPEPFYQYHPLFQEFLLSRVKTRFTGDAIAAIQKDTARILESTGQVENAHGLYVDAGDWGNAVRLICAEAPLLMAQGRGATISTWLSRLPHEVIDQTPWLLYWKGVLNLLTNQRESQSCFERAYDLFDVQGDAAGVYLSWCGVVNVIFHAFEDFSKFDRWIVLLDEIRAKYPVFLSEDIRARVTYSIFLALIYRNPMHPDFHTWAEEAIEIFHHDRDSCLRMEVAFHLVCYNHMAGDLARASLIIEQLRQSASTLSETAPLSLLGWKATEAFYSWLTGSPEECLKAVHEGLKVSEETTVHHLDYILLGQGISGSLSSGNLPEAKRLLKRMASSLERGSRNDRSFYHFVAAWDALLREDIPHALEYARSGLRSAAELGGSWQMFLSKIMMAQALHEKGEEEGATDYLSQTSEFASQSKSPFFEYMCQISSARFALNRGDNGSCLEALRKAMVTGREKGIINFWGWRADVMARLCAKALEAEIEVEHVQGLIRKRILTTDPPPLHINNWPWPVKIFTLGRFEVERDGTPIQFTDKGQRKPLQLLKVIIALGGQKVSEWEISEALWPEADKETYSALTTLISRLRGFIGQEAVLQKQGYVTLDPQLCFVDIWALERLLHQAEKTDQADPIQEDLMEKILYLYQGPFLKEDEMSWAYSVRERLASKFIRYLRKRSRYLEQKEEYEQAITLHQRGLEADPLSEGHYRCLMACYHGLGRRAEAITVYERCRKALSTLRDGVKPSRGTEMLYQKIKGSGE